MLRTTVALIGLAAAIGTADASPISGKTVYSDNGRFALHYTAATHPSAPPAVDTHILFMNKCTGGCSVSYNMNAAPDNRIDRSDIGGGNLSAFSSSAATWQAVMSCMQNTFSRFNVTITDVDPGTTPHMEVMVAGTGAQLGQQQGVLGIADFPCGQVGQCDTFVPNSLVFAFANDNYYATRGSVSNNANEICATAAQEIAHTWSLDHVVDASDPMTYNDYTVNNVIAIRQYKDNQRCGSDCNGGQSPFGSACTGSGGQATHVCAGTGTATQNEVTLISQLFGTSAPDTTPPTVAITAPGNNASVTPGFSVTANVTDNQAVASAELKLDGTSIGVDTQAPFMWTTPSTLTQGAHTIVVIGTDLKGNTAMATETVIYGSACQHDSDCTGANEVCNAGACVAGPGAAGGLGSPCTANSDCASGSCGNDGTSQYCVSSCDPTASACPSGFQCDDTGGGAGVCWPGETGGSGGCNTSGGSSAPLTLFGFGAMFLVVRRRRN